MRFTRLVAATLLAATPLPAAAKDSEVFVLGALHALHEKEDSFGYDTLGRLIRAIRPDVILLEVTPEELAGRLETKGRPEYPKVIWPMLGEGGPKPYAMEARQPLYAELTGEASRRWGDFAAAFPAENGTLTAWSKATSDMLLAHWKSVADTQDEATDTLARARGRLNVALVPDADPGQARWDGAMVEVARKAIAENPGRRVLVLGSWRNRFMFVDALGAMKGAKLVDMKAWLGANGFGRP